MGMCARMPVFRLILRNAMSQPQRITIATADATALGGFLWRHPPRARDGGRNMPMPDAVAMAAAGRRTGPGHHQRRDLGALPLLLALRRIPARPRLRCADLRLSRHRRIAAGVDARLPGVLDGLGPEGFRGGADLCPARVSRPAGGRGRAQHRRFRDRAGAVQPSRRIFTMGRSTPTGATTRRNAGCACWPNGTWPCRS